MIYLNEFQSDLTWGTIIIIGFMILIAYLFVSSDDDETQKSFDEKINPLTSSQKDKNDTKQE
ncbi:MAG: hypothetical protein M3384_13065 [Acidobacteriota bacterium]|nr:hypothetical protein [Acidobacteriota bacterium]